jgi:hypothetical protein
MLSISWLSCSETTVCIVIVCPATDWLVTRVCDPMDPSFCTMVARASTMAGARHQPRATEMIESACHFVNFVRSFFQDRSAPIGPHMKDSFLGQVPWGTFLLSAKAGDTDSRRTPVPKELRGVYQRAFSLFQGARGDN